MRILYLTFNDPYRNVGAYTKELGFCKAMYETCSKSKIQFKGIDIFASEHSNINSLPNSDYFELREVDDKLHNIFSKVRLIRAFFRVRPVFHDAYEEINLFKPNVIIYRYDPTYIPVSFNPKQIRPDILFLSEHQAKEVEELYMSFLNHIFLPFERIKETNLYNNVDAVVAVTSEIAKYQIERANKVIPYFALTNSTDVERSPIKKYLDFKGDLLRMIFVGSSTGRRHGLDRLIMGIKNYRGDVKLELNIVGFASKHLMNLVKSLDLEKQILFHGLKHGKSLDHIFDNMHIAIGTLGIHRIGLKYGSTLKVREYTARGIPFVISYVDEDIEDDFDLLLKLPSDDSSVNMDEVITFAKRVYDKYGLAIPSIMRNYAIENMDYKVKVNGFLHFILDLLKLQRS